MTWATSLEKHSTNIAAIDFFTVSTVTFHVLYGLVIMSHDRRRILHVNATTSPSSRWAAQQLREAFPFWEVPRHLIRDNDAIFGEAFSKTAKQLGIKEVRTAIRSPWQNAYCERLIGSIRRECLDHIIVLNERHLRRVLSSYTEYYNRSRTHCSLDGDAPEPPPVQP